MARRFGAATGTRSSLLAAARNDRRSIRPLRPARGNEVKSAHRPGLATRKSSDVNGRAQSPHRPDAGVKRPDARRAIQTLAQRILHPTAPAGGPVRLPGARGAKERLAAQSPDRLSDNAKNSKPRSRDRPAPAPAGVPAELPTTMPRTRIRSLVARQPALPAWPHLPFSPLPAAS